jgi:hypothetical protein
MDKYFEQKENKRGEVGSKYWCFPPVKIRSASEKRKYRENIDSYRSNEENLNESDLDEKSRKIPAFTLEDEYTDFPDPLEYLIGFYACKSSTSFKYKKSSHTNHVPVSSSPTRKPPVVQNNYVQESEPKVFYKSYYNCKRPSKPENEVFSVKLSTDSAIKSKYKVNSALHSSHEKPNIFSKNKHSIDYPLKYSKTIDEDDRL